MQETIVIAGATGAVGEALVLACQKRFPGSNIHGLLRRERSYQSHAGVRYHAVDYFRDQDLAGLAGDLPPIDLMIVAIGALHREGAQPEKALSALSADHMLELYRVNTVIPALLAKHFAPRLRKGKRAVFSALSARVGSTTDNALGGWYSYRCSKAALNMLIKTTAIEIARKNPSAVVLGLHPGTVTSRLSAPFLKNVPNENLFSPQQAAERLLDVLDRVTHLQSGSLLAWDGREIAP